MAGRRRGHRRRQNCRVERDEQDEARPAKSKSIDGPHLNLGRLRLKTRSDFSIAGTAWRTLSPMYRRVTHVKTKHRTQAKTRSPPVVSPQSMTRVLVHRYVTTIHTRGGAHTVDLFDGHNRCLVSHTSTYLYQVPSRTHEWANLYFEIESKTSLSHHH